MKTCCDKCLKCPDYPNGNGHNYCHDADCVCHTTPEPSKREMNFGQPYKAPEPAKTVEETWLELFTSGLPTIVTQGGVTKLHPDFLNALSSHRSSIIEEVVRMAEGMKADGWSNFGKRDLTEREVGHNTALDTLIRKLREV